MDRKSLLDGIDAFEKLKTRNYYYIDKTAFKKILTSGRRLHSGSILRNRLF